jgi:predicted acyl esterase
MFARSVQQKWMRAHREQVWPDQYTPNNIEVLRSFFDRYLKNINNGWELTPRYRIEVMDAFDYDYQSNRPEKEFPLARTEYKKLYLDASNGSMNWEPAEKEARISYESETEQVNFDVRFEEDTEIPVICGFALG